MSLSKSIYIKANSINYSITVFDKQTINKLVRRVSSLKTVNIYASGPSIVNIDFDLDLLSMPSIFMNGSLSLTKEHNFKNIIAYVISDKRFIKHNPEVLAQFYKGQTLFATQAVYEAIALRLPDLIKWYHSSMYVIFPVNEPLKTNPKMPWVASLSLINKITRQKLPLYDFLDHPSFIIKPNHKPSPIGVSLDMTNGFVEAGTVAYVAAQLAYTLGAKQINLYGIDLINSNQPRFYESRDNAAPCKLDKAIKDRIVPSFELMGREYRAQGVNVINHSTVSKSLFG